MCGCLANERILAEKQLFHVLYGWLDIQCVVYCIWSHMPPGHVLARIDF